MFFSIAEYERAAKIRKIAIYRFLESLLGARSKFWGGGGGRVGGLRMCHPPYTP